MRDGSTKEIIMEDPIDVAQLAWRSLSIVDNHCMCGYDKSLILSNTDRHNLPNKVLQCERCKTIRNEMKISRLDLKEFYQLWYPRMHPGFKSDEDYYKRQATILNEEFIWPHIFRGLEVGGGAIAHLNLASYDIIDFTRDLDCNPEIYDVILAIHVLEHQPDPVAFLHHLKGYLALSGTMIIVVPNLNLVYHHRDVQRNGGNIRYWWQLAHPWNWTFSTIQLPFAAAGLHIRSVNLDRPGSLATVGSIIIEAQQIQCPNI